jgi:uncharacterized protein (TIGR02757 family)
VSAGRDPEIAAFLEEIYSTCNVLSRLRRDPLAIVRNYDDPADREVAGLICSVLAFGSVDLIMRASRAALEPLGADSARALAGLSESSIAERWSAFQYRFCFPRDMIALIVAVKRAREEAGSLEKLFLDGDPGGEDLVAAAGNFAQRLRELGTGTRGRGSGIRPGLLPDPGRGSACKRLFLFLRWMVREDAVDPGGWKSVDPARLVVPIDTHMARVCSARLRFIPSPVATLRAALVATAAFRLYSPDDPVKYDFALTRPGIDPEPGDKRFVCA